MGNVLVHEHCDGLRSGGGGLVCVVVMPCAPTALRATADTLFAHKESMPEAAYLAISDAMKRSHETI